MISTQPISFLNILGASEGAIEGTIGGDIKWGIKFPGGTEKVVNGVLVKVSGRAELNVSTGEIDLYPTLQVGSVELVGFDIPVLDFGSDGISHPFLMELPMMRLMILFLKSARSRQTTNFALGEFPLLSV